VGRWRLWQWSGAAGRAGSVVAWGLLLAVAVAWAILLRPISMGGSTTWVFVRGTSMLPGYHTGDLVITHASPVYRVGDVVAYEVPAGEFGAGHVVIHRLVGGDAASGFVVQGDNNDAPDPWHPTPADILGRAWLWVPGLGRLISLVRQPITLAALATAIVVGLMILRGGAPSGVPVTRLPNPPLRRRLWPGRRRPEVEPGAAAPG
jgi:signal peptidase